MSARIRELVPEIKELHTINFGIQNFPEQLNLEYKEDIILSNRLHKPLYNIDKIILGFKNLIINYPNYNNYRLVIAASGTETGRLKEMITQLNLTDKVEFLGMLSYPELITWYKRAKIFVSIPETDATSLSVLEALGYGCYPVLSNLPANLEWVIDEINGTICQNISLLDKDLAHALNRVENTTKYQNIAQFNYTLINEKAVFKQNLTKFLRLYSKHFN
jgi:glycosyltransferase involved in cell wall biosynthesis